MKKYLCIFFTVCLIVVTSCEEFLERSPLSDMSQSTYFANKSDMKAWLAGIYDAFQSTLDREHIEWGDIRSDNYHTTSYDDGYAYYNALVSTQSDYSWENLYKTINRCNVAIERFPNVSGVSEGDWSDYVGQAYGMRAYMYFYAIRVWGDVPLVTDSWDGETESSYVSRTSVDSVKNQILSDIDNAVSYLNTSVTSDRKYYINRAAVQALKIDVDMWFGEYQEAIDDFDEYFLNNSNYNLVTDADEWKNIFLSPTESEETIFNMEWDYESDGAQPWAQRVGASNTNNPYKVSQGIFEEFVTRLRSGKGADGRFWNVLDTVKMYYGDDQVPVSASTWDISSKAGIEKCTKYSAEDLSSSTAKWGILSSSNCDIEVSLYRYADILLLKAEALNQVGRGDEALEIVNQIRSRVGYLADAKEEVDVNDKEAVETVILLERQLEFMAEGKRWFDLVRTDRIIDVMDPILRSRQDDSGVEPTGFGHEGRILCPIYYREFESNPALQGDQNPPYSEG